MQFNLKDTITVYGAGTQLEVKAAGTSEGAMKGWDARGRKNANELESRGWHHAGSWRQSGEVGRIYMHEDFPGHMITVNRDGSWKSEKESETRAGNPLTKTIADSNSLNPDHKGYGNLGQHLDRFIKVSDLPKTGRDAEREAADSWERAGRDEHGW